MASGRIDLFPSMIRPFIMRNVSVADKRTVVRVAPTARHPPVVPGGDASVHPDALASSFGAHLAAQSRPGVWKGRSESAGSVGGPRAP